MRSGASFEWVRSEKAPARYWSRIGIARMRRHHPAKAYSSFLSLVCKSIASTVLFKLLSFARIKGSSNYRASNVISAGEHERR